MLLGIDLYRQVRHESSYQSDLKTILSDLVPKKQAEVKEFRSQHGSKVVGEVTVDMVSDVLALFTTSPFTTVNVQCNHTPLSRCTEV